jgi:RNA polymerase sigma-70 factor (ECF subfamily)
MELTARAFWTAARPVGYGDDPELIALLSSARGGDPTALAAIYDRYARELYGLALWSCGSPDTAADAVQELFCRVASGVGAGSTDPVRDPRAWLLAGVRRCAVDAQRRRQREIGLEVGGSLAQALLAPAPETHREDHQRLASALATLPPKLREALYLRHWSELSYAEIGRILDVPLFTVASRCRLGLARLRRALRVEGDRAR